MGGKGSGKKVKRPCGICGGTGVIRKTDASIMRCPACSGTGWVLR